MATVPTFEDLLLEVHQSLGLESGMASKAKAKYRAFDNELSTFQEKTASLLTGIFNALDMGEQACRDAFDNTVEWIAFHEELGQNTWSGNASAQQVTWHLLMYSYIPGMARRLAFWSLAGFSRGVPMDSGMPGGDFWFLPSIDGKTGEILKMPVVKVCDWLLELLDSASWANLSAQGLGRNEGVERTLQNWRSSSSTPQSAKKVDELFPINAQLKFPAALVVAPDQPFDEKMRVAMEFVRRKGLSADTLNDQLPMTVVRLKDLLEGSAPQSEKEAFLHWLTLRYAAPTIPTIRQRLKVARMVQDGCQRLLRFLVPEGPQREAEKLRLLRQMLALFRTVYNLTVQAYQQADTPADQDTWFESRLAPWDKADLLLSIVPSLQAHHPAALLGERLSRQFMQLVEDSPLPDLVALDDSDTSKEAIKRRLKLLKSEAKEAALRQALLEKMQRSSPWRALQAEETYEVILPLAQDFALPEKWHALAVQRLRELATAEQLAEVGNVELTYLFSLSPLQRPRDMQARVEDILVQVEASPRYAMWKAPLLRWRGRHALLQNDFKAAIDFHKQALEACKERQFGDLPGEVARDGWAVELAEDGFIPKNQEYWFRRMARDNRFVQVATTIEDAAVWLWEFLDSDLYQPYHGVERTRLQGSDADWTFVCDALIGFSANEDWKGLSRWLKSNATKCRKIRLDPIRRNTVVMQWIKFVHGSEVRVGVPYKDWEQLQAVLPGWREALRLMIEAWPEQATMADFKGQTPLMLVADHGDLALTTLLAPLSDIDAQDVRGRTALHAAVASRSPECVAVVLEQQPAVDDKVSVGEDNTPLHTAVRFGHPACVRLIAHEYPSLLEKRNAQALTPLDMAEDIQQSYIEWQAFMKRESRTTGSRSEFGEIAEFLRRFGLDGDK